MEESILGLDLECEEEELSPTQIAAQEKAQANYERATGLVQNWRKNKRKVLSYTTDGLQMYSAKPIVPKPAVVPPTPTPIKFVSQSGTIFSGVRPIVSTSNNQGTIILPPGAYNQQFRGVVRQTRPIQISTVGPPPLRQQTITTQAPFTFRPATSTGANSVMPVQQLIFDANSGLLLMPQQGQQQNVGPTTLRIPNSVNVNIPARPTTVSNFMDNRQRMPITSTLRRTGPAVTSSTPYNPPTTTTAGNAGASGMKTYLTPKIVSSTSLNPLGKQPVQNQQNRAQIPAVKPLTATVPGKPAPSSGATPSSNGGIGAANPPSGGSNSENDANNRTFPSLVVSVKPCLHDKPSKVKTSDARTDLDGRVKALLIYQPSKFTEWLMQRGLLKLEHKCTVHLTAEKEPIPYKLGMYSDGNKQPFSGGYVWISECCAEKQITVFQGSIFEASVYPPGTLLKLVYHWSCQTTAANVLMWVKVTSYYLKNFYTLLRSACVAALHEFCPLMGGKSKFVEVGIITLGTTLSVQNGQKQVKVEILGVFDPTTKVIRMKVINPQNVGVTSASHSRVMQILWPLNHWVDKTSIILIDTSIEKSLLLEMGFKNVHQCKSNAPNSTQKSATPTNVNVMNYLKHVVPKMFQNTLCVLSKSLIQQFLDELSWRELWGETPATTFDTMINHLVQMTKWETGESLISRLNRISLNPFGEWSYSRGRSRGGIDSLPESIRGSNEMPELSIQVPLPGGRTNGNVGPGAARRPINNIAAGGGIRPTPNRPPVLIPQIQQTPLNQNTVSALKRKMDSPIEVDLNRHYMIEPKSIGLQSYYYAECPGNSLTPLGSEFPTTLKCPLCSKLFISNQEVIRHIFMHVQSMGIRPSSLHSFCEYCLKDVGPVTSLQSHINEVHKMMDAPFPCLICQEKFHNETNLVLHMWENHGKSEMPYKCEICDYKTSFHYDVVNHFNKEHSGTDSVLCPLCLKVLTAKSFTCMKQVVVHLQSHTIRKGKKCGQCTLTFNGEVEFRAHVNENPHQNEDLPPSSDRTPVPFAVTGSAEIKMAKPPKVKRITVPPVMPPLKKVARIENTSAGTARKPNSLVRLQMQGDGSQYHFNELNIQFSNAKTNSTKCLECLKLTGNEDHFPGYMVCIKCRFATCCRMSMINHNLCVHPNVGDINLKSSFNVKSAETLDALIYCGCGFETRNGNKMVRHLISCEKTTALSDPPEECEDGEEEVVEVDKKDISRTSSPIPNLLGQLGLTRKTD